MNTVAIFSFLKSVQATNFPEPGETLYIKSSNPTTGKFEDIELKRPFSSDPMMEYVHIDIIFKIFDFDQIFTLLACILHEEKIIITTNNLSKLSEFSNAVVAMIYPFTWQHIYIPILPPHLIDYVCSPIPFIIGLLSIKPLNNMETDTVCICDLDQKQLKFIIKDKKFNPPKLPCNIKQFKKDKSFLNLFLSMIGNYRKYIKDKKFDQEKFLKDKKDPFYINLLKTQMWERFIYEKENSKENSSDIFEKESLNCK